MPVYTCNRCGKVCSQRSNLIVHLQRKKQCEPLVADVECIEQLKYLRTQSIARKIECKHTCDKCNKLFATKQTLQRHIDSFHADKDTEDDIEEEYDESNSDDDEREQLVKVMRLPYYIKRKSMNNRNIIIRQFEDSEYCMYGADELFDERLAYIKTEVEIALEDRLKLYTPDQAGFDLLLSDIMTHKTLKNLIQIRYSVPHERFMFFTKHSDGSDHIYDSECHKPFFDMLKTLLKSDKPFEVDYEIL